MNDLMNFFKKVYREISPKELSKLMKENKLQLIDCRTPEELTVSKVNGFVNIPMHEIHLRMNEFSKEDDLYIMCRSGHRSADVCEYLYQHGFKEVYNVVGGINAWADEVDSTLEKY